MAHWIKIPDQKNKYQCSACGAYITTGLPIEYWTECPFCFAVMNDKNEEADNGNLDTKENP